MFRSPSIIRPKDKKNPKNILHNQNNLINVLTLKRIKQYYNQSIKRTTFQRINQLHVVLTTRYYIIY